MTLDPHAWTALWTRLTGSADGAVPVFRRLRRAHGQFWRAYHDASHVAEVLAELSSVRDRLEDQAVAEVAVWFHDAVYVPWRGRNEERSAEMARRWLTPAGIDPARIDRVVSHILATRHGELPDDPDARFVVDADLAILGAPDDRFAEYERQIRREYWFVPRSRYVAGRSAILRGFLDRDRIFATEPFRARLEDRARANLGSALGRLGR